MSWCNLRIRSDVATLRAYWFRAVLLLATLFSVGCAAQKWLAHLHRAQRRLQAYLQPATSYVDGSVLSGQTYYYVVTALGTNSEESTYSNEAVAVIP
jgi:hypothetical protein